MADTAPFRVWFFANFEESVQPACVYTTPEAAQHAAVIDYEAADSGPMFAKVTYDWRTADEQPDHHMLFEDGVFTGYWVQPLEVVDREPAADIDPESVAGRVAVWLDGWERYYRDLGLPEDAVLIAGPPPGAEPRTSAAGVRFVLNALSITLKRYAETKTVLGDALELLSARADGTPHIVETTIGLDPFSPDAPHWTVHHPLQCHRLSYGEGCEFDVAVDRWGLRSQFPLEVGRFEARIEEYDGVPGAELMLERLDGKAGPQ